MTLDHGLDLDLALAGAALLALILAGSWWLARAVRRPPLPPPAREHYPSLTVIRPIKGLDTGARENLEALLAMDYPGPWEVLLVLDDPQDPAFSLVREVVAQHRAKGDRVQLLLAGRPSAGRTGKLNAMLFGLERAKGELVAFNDSDTRPGPQLLRVLVDELLSSPKTGSVFAPVVGRSDQPLQAGDVGYLLLLNAWYGPSAALAAQRAGGLPFIMGQVMVFTRPVLKAIGGLECADGRFVDDMWIGRCVAQAGYRNVQIEQPLPIALGGMSAAAFVRTFRRWLLFAEGGLPLTFVWIHILRATVYVLAWIALAAGLARGASWGLVPSAAVIVAFVASELVLNRRMGGTPIPPKFLWIPLVLPFVGAGVAASTLVWKRVDWRGRSYDLTVTARLAPMAPQKTRSA